MPFLCENCKRECKGVVQQTDPEVKGQLWCRPCHKDRKFSGRFDVAAYAIPDEFPTELTFENYGKDPITFHSRSQHKAYLEKHELHLKERWCPLPGTDRDPAGVQNPEGYVDKVTLDNRAELFLRAHNAREAEPDIEMRPFSGTLSNQDAIAVATGSDPVRQSRVHRRTAEQTHGQQ